ncbi:hypothetical protein CH63R_14311 [Colletotrichum higginsianum IMI 349063]|uniref:Uncharacterized protein n=1 Tax=Colletotrichum higginsianum (strain IMI 349063) TaxID=759273 RepID=A0A1B7XTJ1_COLHI|nr:hypothetical protein CH63R_14311 [Colletotrichum higginsianum IMI 349063]OBR03085.1 hypothetical protein CH63R_14311 [Colletotrichum higginsianum IMI 349063]
MNRNWPNPEFQLNVVKEHSDFRDLDRLLDSSGNDFLYARKPLAKHAFERPSHDPCMPACRHLLPAAGAIPGLCAELDVWLNVFDGRSGAIAEIAVFASTEDTIGQTAVHI